MAFSKQHLPKKTAEIEATHAEDYGKKNARLDERIAGLKAQGKQSKISLKADKTKGKVDVKTKKEVKAQTAKKNATPVRATSTEVAVAV